MPYKDPKQQKAAQKAWYERNKDLTYERTKSSREKRKEIIRKIKESSPCADCDMSYPYYIMHFDHLDYKIKIDKISNLIQTKKMKVVLEEIEKCELVCSNCHSIRTWKRQHGLML
jgi:hypothetical protein